MITSGACMSGLELPRPFIQLTWRYQLEIWAPRCRVYKMGTATQCGIFGWQKAGCSLSSPRGS